MQATVTTKVIEQTEEEKRVLKAINEKAQGNLALKLRLLALYNYSVIESEQSEQMSKDMDVLNLKYRQLAVPLINRVFP